MTFRIGITMVFLFAEMFPMMTMLLRTMLLMSMLICYDAS